MYNYYRHLLTYLIIKKKKVFDVFRFTNKNKCNAFVILCEPRSGSTLLHTYLNSHAHIRSHGEALRENIEKGKTEETILNFLNHSVIDFKSSNIGAVGLKLFYDYFKNPLYRKYFATILQRKDVRIIHLTRVDTLRLFVSLKMAQKTNVWSTGKKNHMQEKIIVDGAEYLKFTQDYIASQKQFDGLFQHHTVLKISYEELVYKPDHILDQVQLFLGVDSRPLFTLLKKQNPGELESIILNNDEVKNLFET